MALDPRMLHNVAEADSKKLEKLDTIIAQLGTLHHIMGPMAGDIRQILELLRNAPMPKS